MEIVPEVSLEIVPEDGSEITTGSGDSASSTVTVKESTGEADAPFLINNELELRQVGTTDSWNLSAHYKLASDITLTQGDWTPIGDKSSRNDTTLFTGSFDGNNKTITGMSIDKPNADYQGMFGYIGIGGEVKNLTLLDCNVNGKDYVGGMAGIMGKATIINCRIAGNVRGIDGVGGVVGYGSFGTVENCYAKGEINGNSAVGGVVGYTIGGTFTNCNVEGVVSGNYDVGGVVGSNSGGEITNSYATGNVYGKEDVGGVAGYSQGTVDNCYATGDINGKNWVGGVVGWNHYTKATVKNSYATGDISGTDYVGGVAGYTNGTVDNCYATGDISGTDYVSGVAGRNEGTITNCNAEGVVNGNKYVSGVAGYNTGTVYNCNATGNVTGTGDSVGGVAGYNTGTVDNCYATGGINGKDWVGGVVGGNGSINSKITNSYATGNVYGTSDGVGGVVGRIYSGSVENCYAMGNVTGIRYVGGVVGESEVNKGDITNCYACGNVRGNSSVGGVVGVLNSKSTLKNSYACGVISGNYYLGGVVGYNQGAVENCVALNPNINSLISSTNSSSGRIGDVSSGTLINNYAQKYMKFNNNGIATWRNDANGNDGADITAAQYQLQSWWNNSAGFDFSATGVWEWHSAGRLPVLKGLGTQAPKVTAVNTPDITYIVSGIAFEMVSINPGTFLMGSPPDEPGRHSTETQHPVTLTKGFFMGKYEVTQAQYEMVMGTNPSAHSFGGSLSYMVIGLNTMNFPVERVSFYAALVFCNKLSMLQRLSPAYRINGSTDPAVWGAVPTSDDATWNAVTIVPGSTGYRLPTEAQWEYSCRADSIEAYNWGTDTISPTQAKYNGQLSRTVAVGSYAPNAWGLYDMHGNVAEWCWDGYDTTYGSEAGAPVTDPMGGTGSANPYIGSDFSRVFHGGSYEDAGLNLRSAYRATHGPHQRFSKMGFRIMRPFQQ
jgi:formylglycine-generating enzyme required for sulfatase activity